MSEARKKDETHVKFATVGNNGQVSIGKEFAGRQVQIEKTPEGVVIISPGKFIPDHHAPFYTKEALEQLDEFDEWMKDHKPKNVDVGELRAKLKANRDKK